MASCLFHCGQPPPCVRELFPGPCAPTAFPQFHRLLRYAIDLFPTPPKLQPTNMPCKVDISGKSSLLRPHCTNLQLTEPLDLQFWTNIYSMEVASTECLSRVQSLLTCPSKITVARSFRGNQAKMFVDFLDRVSEYHALCLDYLAEHEM